jgi:phage terminase small subunit
MNAYGMIRIMSRKPKSRDPWLTKKERKFLKAIVKGRNQSQAAIAAGYSPKNPDVSGAIAMAQLRRKVPDILIRMGLYPEKVFKDVLVPGLA